MKRAAFLLAMLCAGPAAAQPAPPVLPPGNTLPKSAVLPQPQSNMPGMPAPGAAYVPLEGGATQEYNAAMTRMMAGMQKPYSGDPDRDFVSHMLPHHQGAIDMAETELKYGHDTHLKQLAARIISAQQREIAVMQLWLDKHPAIIKTK